MAHAPNNPFVRSVRAALLVAVTVTLASCASSSNGSIRVASDAEATQNYDLAVAEYTKLVRSKPSDRNAQQGLERAKLRAAQDHYTRARRFAATGKLEDALVEYQLASELNPSDGDVNLELQDTRKQLRAKIAIRDEGKTRLESLIAQSLDAPLPGATLPTGMKLPDSLVFREAGSRDVYSAIGKFTNLSVLFDPSFRDQPMSIDRSKRPWRRSRRPPATSGGRPRPTRSRSSLTPPPNGASMKKNSSARST